MPVDESDHESFERPPDDAVLWRYLDLAKYLRLLVSGALWFSRMDLLGDPFEGSVTALNLENRREVWKEILDSAPAPRGAEVLDGIARMNRDFRYRLYASCWHESAWESAAMWRLYMRDHGIAVRTTYRRMKEAIGGSETVFVGRVRYADYKRDSIPEGNVFHAAMHKRRSFEHEREVRAITLYISPTTDPTELPPLEDQPEGIAVATSPQALIESVRIAPEAPDWFAELVSDLTRRLGFEMEIRQSDLRGDPVF